MTNFEENVLKQLSERQELRNKYSRWSTDALEKEFDLAVSRQSNLVSELEKVLQMREDDEIASAEIGEEW